MREVAQQQSLRDLQLSHDSVEELRAVSKLLDDLGERFLPQIKEDLLAGVKHPQRGRRGMTAPQVLRCLVLMKMRGLTYRELSFQLHDSQSARAFAGVGLTDRPPSASTLHDNISKLSPESLRGVNEAMVQQARSERIDYGSRVAIDCTVVESKIPYPTDSQMLRDCIRVLIRLGKRYGRPHEIGITDKTRSARKTAMRIMWSRGENRKRLYSKLLKITHAVVCQITTLIDDIDEARAQAPWAVHDDKLRFDLEHFIATTRKIIDQTERRWSGEKVPASEKLVSVFEQHADIIRKDYRTTYYGHKISVTKGRSDLILDFKVHEGNRNDADMAEELLDRQVELYGRAPRQAVMDGAFCSRANLDAFKGKGVKDVVFSRRRGIPIDEMAESRRIYRRLKKFRSSVERVISFVKRRCNLRKCTWSGIKGFKRYVAASVVTANLLTFARKRITKRDTG